MDSLDMKAYRIRGATEMGLVPAKRQREWHKDIPATGACLPLTIANEAGWWLVNPHRFTVFNYDQLTIDYCGFKEAPHVASHFGHGILTVLIPFIFRTPPGWQLQIRGPVNYFYDDMQPFEGIVETDWHKATATMNWKVARDSMFTVEEGEPLAQLVPVKLDVLEMFRPTEEDMPEDVERDFIEWASNRAATLKKEDYKYERGYPKHAERRRLDIKPWKA